MSTVSRRYIEELSALLQKEVVVDTVNGQTFTGILSGFNPDSMSVCLSNARDDKGRQAYE